MTASLCFVLIPSGRKPAAGGHVIDFDALYREVIQPAIAAAGLEPLRADEGMAGALMHRPTFERLLLCETAVVDLTSANANVFYELGLRHALRARSTTLIYAKGLGQLPFDVRPLRALAYRIGRDGTVGDAADTLAALTGRLLEGRERGGAADSPIYDLVEKFPDIQRLKTDVFRDRVHYCEALKSRLARARKLGKQAGPEALRKVEAALGNLGDADAGVVVDLMLSYRAVEAWTDMIALVDRMSAPLAASVLVQEQLGFALNRAGHSDLAEKTLVDVLAHSGPSSETYGLLGRVYKDRYQAALKAGNLPLAHTELDKAIDAYLRGFNTDIRDAFPGINAATLMELRDPPDERRLALLPVITYAVRMRIDTGQPDYWDFATLVELGILGRDRDRTMSSLRSALASVRESWEPRSTLNNLRLIREARARRGDTLEWAAQVEIALEDRGQEVEAGKA